MTDTLHGFLEGLWSLQRAGHDRRTGDISIFTGTASFVPDSNALLYTERVTWTAAGQTLHGHRSYRFTFTGPWSAQVWFLDGRFFHALNMRQNAATVVHTCPPDHYTGWYRLDGTGTYTTHWTIQGPRKNIDLHTRYQRRNR